MGSDSVHLPPTSAPPSARRGCAFASASALLRDAARAFAAATSASVCLSSTSTSSPRLRNAAAAASAASTH
eukprot:2790249-Pyramimonas_sp.AAC.1